MIVLVDENDKDIGQEEKIKAHELGLLHRAFSVLVFNDKNETLIQKRHSSKYHCGGLWANTCCSHPFPNEDTIDAAHRRLQEELGFDCDLKEIFSFTYKKYFEDSKLYEHEFDHVFVGNYNGEINPNPEEIEDTKWISLEDLKKDMEKNPDSYAYWFKKIIEKLDEHHKSIAS